MKLYIKTNKSGMITESSLVSYDKKEKAEAIEVTEEQLQLIRDRHDTKVEDGEIVEQKEGKNAEDYRNQMINIEKNETDRRQQEDMKSQSKSAE